jgi:superfamily I DNA/RNA helicase
MAELVFGFDHLNFLEVNKWSFLGITDGQARRGRNWRLQSNRLSIDALHARLQDGMAGHFLFRHTMFLQLYESLFAEWALRLRKAGCIDFEDMLNLATDCIERRQWSSPYELVMVDEFRDASQARARMIAGLVLLLIVFCLQ